MPVPAHRRSSTRVRTRRAHHALDSVSTASCKNCQAIVLPHKACTACGFYAGRFVKVTKKRAA